MPDCIANELNVLLPQGQALRLATRFSEVNLKFQITKLRSTI
jgi:hypothetical protein